MKYLNSLAIAKIAHEVNRAYCESIGDTSRVAWVDAPEWQRNSVLNGVDKTLAGQITTPEEAHQSWSDHMVADGWIYGARKDPEMKTHPCLVPYDELPAEQQVKDALFFAVVRAAAA